MDLSHPRRPFGSASFHPLGTALQVLPTTTFFSTTNTTQRILLPIGANSVERLVEEIAELLVDEVDECVVVFGVDEAIGEDAEAFMHPKPDQGLLRVVEVAVRAQQTLEDLG